MYPVDKKDVVKARSIKRPASVSIDEGGPRRRVQFSEQVETQGLERLVQQLDQWSQECIVCYFTDKEYASSGRRHIVQECKQEVAAQIIRQSRHMDKWMKRVEAGADQGVCAGCNVPWAVYRSWKRDKRYRGWIKDPGKGVLVQGRINTSVDSNDEIRFSRSSARF